MTEQSKFVNEEMTTGMEEDFFCFPCEAILLKFIATKQELNN